MTVHELAASPHYLWSAGLAPVLTVTDGDVLEFEVTEASDGQLAPPANAAAIDTFDWSRLYPLRGPVYVAGAKPGDTVEIEMLNFTGGSWGWTCVIPGMGLLAEDFPDAHLHHWDLTDPAGADFLGIARVPHRPFLGVTGVCPAGAVDLPVVPPGAFGGNIDCRDLVAGSRLFLPVQVEGALLSLGDPHAAQGDGEVCVSAIEASLSGAVRVRLHQGRTIPAPQFQTAGPLRPNIEDAGMYATTGVAPSLMDASRAAVRAMIDHLGREYGLDPIDAYVLCSVAVDLKITEVVDVPNWVVSAYLPLSLFP